MLGPLSFLVLIDDLNPDCLVYKYVDDTTLTELLKDRTKPSNMQFFIQQLLSWVDSNDMVVNFGKTKEMVMGPPSAQGHRYCLNIVDNCTRWPTVYVLKIGRASCRERV